ncbi:MAG: hypothetical protein AAF570_12185 [Bacteroidota bacterium]
MKYKQFAIGFLLLFFVGHLAAQETKTPLTLAIKTHPFQYIFKEANLSVELQSGLYGIEFKASAKLPVPFVEKGPIYDSPASSGDGSKFHLMYRRYIQNGVAFVAIGLVYKRWTYTELDREPEPFSGLSSRSCQIESRVAHIPGIKVLMGVKLPVLNERALVEPFMGTALRRRFFRTVVHNSGFADTDCATPDFTPYQLEDQDWGGAIYVGLNVGVNWRLKKERNASATR